MKQPRNGLKAKTLKQLQVFLWLLCQMDKGNNMEFDDIDLQTYKIQPPLKYKTTYGISNVVFLENVKYAAYDTMVKISLANGQHRHGRVIHADTRCNNVCVQIFDGSMSMNKDAEFEFSGKIKKIGVSPEMLNRIFNGVGDPIDDMPQFIPEKMLDIKGMVINPLQRTRSYEIIETGISTIDTMMTISTGQRIALMSGSGLPHNQIIAQIIKQSRLINIKTNQITQTADFCIVFIAMGLTLDEGRYFKTVLMKTGLMINTVMFINFVNDPQLERLMMPKIGMTVAEYFAFECGKNVLVIMHDMATFANAYKYGFPEDIREPFFFDLKMELSSIFERAGTIKDCAGSITLLSVVTMPNDDWRQTIPAWIAENTDGTIHIDRELYESYGLYPPINIITSQSYPMKYFMNNGLMETMIGAFVENIEHNHNIHIPSTISNMIAMYCHNDFMCIYNEVQKRYLMAKDVEAMKAIVVDSAMVPEEVLYLKFKCKLERKFIQQHKTEHRTFMQSLDLLTDLLSLFD